MCSICGCGQPDGPSVTIDGAGLNHHDPHHHHHGGDHTHHHQHGHGDHDHGAHHHDTHNHGEHHDTRLIQLEQDLLGKNDRLAAANRAWFEAHGVLALNLVSSPGSGKTTLLARTAEALHLEVPLGVIEGDQQTSRDAERIRATGAPAVQINTGKACHLDAHMVGHAVEHLAGPDPGRFDGGVLFIENVGNLVCPAAFDLGEAHKVVIVSVTEGEDKPLKYAPMFAAADTMILSKIDLLPHVEFAPARCIDHARRVHPGIEVLELSATTGEGIAAWLAWIKQALRERARGPVAVAGV